MYRCRTLSPRPGASACYNNTIEEGPLVRCIVRKIQEQYTSETALNRLRKALEAEQGRTRPRPRDLARLRREIEVLDRKIDNAEDTVLEAPPEIRSGLYRKLQEFTAERDRLKTELGSLTARETRPDKRDGSEVDRAIDALRTLGEALTAAGPEETRELLASFVSRIELYYDHQETEGGRKTSSFSHGLVYVRPDAGEGRAAQPDSGFAWTSAVVPPLPGFPPPRLQRRPLLLAQGWLVDRTVSVILSQRHAESPW